jgi:hypothetical protein
VSCWLPDCAGLPGSGAANAAAKDATSSGIPASERALGNDVPAYLHPAILSFFVQEWTATHNNRLQTVKTSVDMWRSFRSIRKEDVRLVRF